MRFEGHVAKYIGDGLLVYFGYPQAHEDDAERAVSAGLGIVEAHGAGLDAAGLSRWLGGSASHRSGGCGRAGRGRDAGADAIVGETPNIAARLEGLATPNTVVMSAGDPPVGGRPVRLLTDLGPHPPEGLLRAAARLPGPRRKPRRRASRRRHGQRLTPLVGREPEIDLLLARWAHAKDGEGQAVLLSGEAGIGKSRIVRAIRERLSDEQHARAPLLRFALSHEQRAPSGHRADAAGVWLRASDGVDDKLDKLEALLDRAFDAAGRAGATVGRVTGIPTRGRYPASNRARSGRSSAPSRSCIDSWPSPASPVLSCWRTPTGLIRRRWSCWACWSSDCAPRRALAGHLSARVRAHLGRARHATVLRSTV